ncbi:MAG: hypothetical protein U0231_11280 [Nitrospiraceae bacterium]
MSRSCRRTNLGGYRELYLFTVQTEIDIPADVQLFDLRRFRRPSPRSRDATGGMPSAQPHYPKTGARHGHVRRHELGEQQRRSAPLS